MNSSRAPTLQCLLLAALSVPMLAGCGGSRARFTAHLERGKQYLEQANLDKASIEFRNALQIQPKDADALYFNGRIAEQRSNTGEAVALYQAVLEVKPGFEEARARLGKDFVFGGAPQRALEVVKPGLIEHPDSPELLAVRAAARHQLKDNAGARADAEHAVQVAPNNENAVAVLAGLYADNGERARAIALVSGAVDRLPSSVDLREVLSSLYVADGQVAKAEAQMAKLIELKPRELALRLLLARQLAQTHDLDAAQHVLEDTVKDFSGYEDRARQDSAKLTLVDFLVGERSREQGEKILRGFIAQDPDNPALRFGLGALLQRTGAVQDAIAAYREVIRRNGTDAQGLVARDRIAAIQLSQGHLEEAGKLVAEVLQKSPRDDDALIMRSNIALEHKDPTAAIADLRAVLRDKPRSATIQRILARAYRDKGQAALAEEALRAALEAAPNDPSVTIDLAQLLSQTDRAAQAVTLLEQGVGRMPADAQLREMLIRAYLLKRDLPAAQAAAEELKARRPESAVGFYLAGLIAGQQKRLAEGEKDLEHALTLAPGGIDVLTSLAQIELALGKGEMALTRVRDALGRQPASAALQNLLGELYFAQKDLKHAGEAFAGASTLDPHAWWAHRNLAAVKLAANDSSGAIAEYEAALKIVPTEPRLVLDLTALYEKQGRVEDAIARYDALYKGSPQFHQLAANNLAMLLVTYRTDQASLDRARDLTSEFATSSDGSLLDTNGWVRFKRREYQDAAAVLERAVDRAPDSKVIRYHLGMAQFQLGQRERARNNLESALAGSGTFNGSDEARTVLASLKARSG